MVGHRCGASVVDRRRSCRAVSGKKQQAVGCYFIQRWSDVTRARRVFNYCSETCAIWRLAAVNPAVRRALCFAAGDDRAVAGKRIGADLLLARKVPAAANGGRTRTLFEVISEAHMNPDAWAGGKVTGEHSESECQVIADGIAASDLSFQLSATQ